MAVVQFYTAFDQDSLQVFDGDTTQADANTIVIDDGLNQAVYSGSFSYDSNANVFGVVDSIDVTLGGRYTFSVDDLNFSANVFQSYVDDDDVQGLFPRLFSGSDAFYGSAGSDGITTYGGADSIFAGAGNDDVDAGAGDDLVFGGQSGGFDQILAGAGDDDVYAGDGNDTVYGEQGSDVLGGGQGSDILDGGADNDVISGGAGAYADSINAGSGSDRMFAGAGNDTVYGGDGDDEVGAGSGADLVAGGAGNDVIYLGGRDGAVDIYQTVANNGNDLVYGFELGIDILDLRGSGFTNFAQVQARLGSDQYGDAAITLASGQVLVLDGVDAAQIDSSDFLF